jgi:hypothetical protein
MLEQTPNDSEKLFETISAIRGGASMSKLSESDQFSLQPIKESKHTDFYYKLESLNEKIKLFKEVFYSSKRDDQKRKQFEYNRERHRQMLKAQEAT